MAKLPFEACALQFEARAAAQDPAALASAALDVEASISEAAFTPDQVHVWAHQTGFPGSPEALLQALGGGYIYYCTFGASSIWVRQSMPKYATGPHSARVNALGIW